MNGKNEHKEGQHEVELIAGEIQQIQPATKVRPGRPLGKKVDWSKLTGNDWRYKSNAQIAEMLGTSVPNVFVKRQKLNKIGLARYTGKVIKRGPKPKDKK
jgi:hypothetical protein